MKDTVVDPTIVAAPLLALIWVKTLDDILDIEAPVIVGLVNVGLVNVLFVNVSVDVLVTMVSVIAGAVNVNVDPVEGGLISTEPPPVELSFTPI